MLEDVFLILLREHIDSLRGKSMPKGKFIALYLQELRSIDKSKMDRYKSPQVINDMGDPTNNWIDYMLGLNDESYEYFKQAIQEC